MHFPSGSSGKSSDHHQVENLGVTLTEIKRGGQAVVEGKLTRRDEEGGQERSSLELTKWPQTGPILALWMANESIDNNWFWTNMVVVAMATVSSRPN